MQNRSPKRNLKKLLFYNKIIIFKFLLDYFKNTLIIFSILYHLDGPFCRVRFFMLFITFFFIIEAINYKKTGCSYTLFYLIILRCLFVCDNYCTTVLLASCCCCVRGNRICFSECFRRNTIRCNAVVC